MTPAMADLAAALHASITDHYGATRINVLQGFIYDGVRNIATLDHHGHVIKLGSWHAGTDALVKAYRAAVAEVAS